ncbi:MAG: GlxA family transcriptional regulator [Desulfobacteraceae bacterium]|nr:GlxA family transcriptional regulator [Desulfobacteraceae bacterium]
MIKLAILALENCMQSSVTGPFDILSVASLEWKRQHPDETIKLFDLRIITDDGLKVTCFNGMKIEPHMSKNDCNVDIILIPVIYGDLTAILSNKGLIDWLYDQNKKGIFICAVCAGVFLAAQTGLLNQRKATTHWHLAKAFQKRYPEVILKKEKMIVDEGEFITAGGATAYMDLCLYLIGRFGSYELASSVSKVLLIDPSRRSQTPYTVFDFNKGHGDENILKVQHWMEKNIADNISIASLADKAGMGLRTFARRFKKATGDTPLEYLQHLRIGKARTLLETTGDSVDTITYATGYEDISSFRRLFKKTTGLPPTAYRKKFSLY